MFEECHISEHFPKMPCWWDSAGWFRESLQIFHRFWCRNTSGTDVPPNPWMHLLHLLCQSTCKGNEWQTWHLAFDMSLLAIHCWIPFCPGAPGYPTQAIQLVSFRGQRDKPYVKKNKIICLCPFQQRKSKYNRPKITGFMIEHPDSYLHCFTPPKK